MRLTRSILVNAATAAVLALGASAALAQDMCTQLEAALISIDRGGQGSPDDYQKYDAAARNQRTEIQRAMAEARRSNCIGGFLGFRNGPPAQKCGPLMAMIDRMQANLARLESKRDQFGYRPRGSSWDRDRILRQLAANNCGPEYSAYRRNNNNDFMSSIFGPPRNGGNGGFWPQDDFFQNDSGLGTYRTLCVRTCDGYYFPISFSTVQSQFARDQQTCQAMCPGEEVKLFYHRNPGEDSEAMVSTDGTPYASEPYAFLYRNNYDSACTCRPVVQASPVGSTGIQPVQIATPLPLHRPEPSDDPDTVANKLNNFVPGPVSPAANPAVAGLNGSAERSVRVVGPSYYYAQ
jgi:hypothetical protein